jgi:hypothetical protein
LTPPLLLKQYISLLTTVTLATGGETLLSLTLKMVPAVGKNSKMFPSNHSVAVEKISFPPKELLKCSLATTSVAVEIFQKNILTI